MASWIILAAAGSPPHTKPSAWLPSSPRSRLLARLLALPGPVLPPTAPLVALPGSPLADPPAALPTAPSAPGASAPASPAPALACEPSPAAAAAALRAPRDADSPAPPASPSPASPPPLTAAALPKAPVGIPPDSALATLCLSPASFSADLRSMLGVLPPNTLLAFLTRLLMASDTWVVVVVVVVVTTPLSSCCSPRLSDALSAASSLAPG
mmetsp:Transcript_8784/g.21736  ORF Transcript_8784/g.21736 Transcript_8784/m.21736 type:complete len:211 (+) Transcript_8784:610-1242(+)